MGDHHSWTGYNPLATRFALMHQVMRSIIVVMQTNIFYQSTCPLCCFPSILEFTPRATLQTAAGHQPHKLHNAVCGLWRVVLL